MILEASFPRIYDAYNAGITLEDQHLQSLYVYSTAFFDEIKLI
jgi:hypothetical protein